jgi:hypothetical protein
MSKKAHVNGVSNGTVAHPVMKRWCIELTSGRQVIVYAPDKTSACARLPSAMPLHAARGKFANGSVEVASVEELPRVEDERHEFVDGRAAPDK